MYLILYLLQKLTEADKLYSSSAAAYMSDPRLCHTTALRLGTATPDDNKHGKDDKMTADNVDKLIPVKEEDVAGGATDYVLGGAGGRVTAVTWCDNVLQTDLATDTVSQLYMCADPAAGQPVSPVSPATLRLTAGSEDTCHVSSTCCSVFSLSECVVSGTVGGGVTGGTVSPVHSVHSSHVTLQVPVTEVRRTVAPYCTAQQHSYFPPVS